MNVSYSLIPSKRRPGYFNVFVLGEGKGWLTVDPNGVQSYDTENIDQNYQQFKRNGLAVEIAPGDDQNPNAKIFVLIPE